MTLFQTIFVPLCALVALLVLARTLRSTGSRRNGLFWTGVWLAAAALIADPSATTTLAKWLGIGRGADLILYLATLAGMSAGLFFYTRYRRLEIMVTGIIRREALQVPRQGQSAPTPAPR